MKGVVSSSVACYSLGKNLEEETSIFNLFTIVILTSTFNCMSFYLTKTWLVTLLTLLELYDFQYGLSISINIPSKYMTSSCKVSHHVSKPLLLRTNVSNCTLNEPPLKHLKV